MGGRWEDGKEGEEGEWQGGGRMGRRVKRMSGREVGGEEPDDVHFGSLAQISFIQFYPKNIFTV